MAPIEVPVKLGVSGLLPQLRALRQFASQMGFALDNLIDSLAEEKK